MKATANRTELASAAKWVARTISKNPNVPILAGVKITTDDRGLTLAATDYDTSVTATVEATVTEDGSTLAGGHALASFIGAFRGDDVSLSTEDSALTLRSGRAVSVVQTMDVGDYPNVRGAEGQSLGEVEAESLAAALATVDALSMRPGDPAIGDLFWQMATSLESDGESLVIIAGTRYAFGRVVIPCALEPFEALVPTATLAGVLSDLSGPLSVYHDGSTFGLVSDSRSVILRTVAVKKLPEFSKFLDAKLPGSAVVEIDSLRSVVKVAQAAGTGRVRLDFGANEIQVSAYKNEKGELTHQISDVVDAEISDPNVTAINGRYLSAVLAALSGPNVTIAYTPGDGTRARQVSFTDGRSHHAIQPITLRSGE